jgi:hypothetical protein
MTGFWRKQSDANPAEISAEVGFADTTGIRPEPSSRSAVQRVQVCLFAMILLDGDSYLCYLIRYLGERSIFQHVWLKDVVCCL